MSRNSTKYAFGYTSLDDAPAAKVSIKGDALGTEEIDNGTFTGNADGWVADGTTPLDIYNWAYADDKIVHSAGDTIVVLQAGTLVEGATYRVAFTVGNMNGMETSWDVLDNGTCSDTIAANGIVTFTGTWNNNSGSKIVFFPSSDFDGTVDNVSVKRVVGGTALSVSGDTYFTDFAGGGDAGPRRGQ